MIIPYTFSAAVAPLHAVPSSKQQQRPSGTLKFGLTPDSFIPKATGYSPELQTLIDQLKAKYAHLKGKNVLLLYSGGLDTSFLTKFFSHEVKANVYTISFDVGEDQRERGKIAARAKELGAVTHLHKDLKEKFANERCAQAIIANALYQDAHPLSSSLSRPLMSETAIDLAKEHGCVGVIHGSSPWQNNAPRFNNALASLSKTIAPITPVLDNNISRNKEDEYLRHFGMIIRAGEDKIYSADYNLWAPEAEDGILQKINRIAGENLFHITKSLESASNTPQYLDIEFEKGLPIRYALHSVEHVEKNPETPTTLAGQASKPLLNLIPELNQIGGEHGIGRYDTLEHRPAGFKEREVHEAPAATMIIQAKKELERCVLDQKSLNKKAADGRLWTEMVCEGDWYHPLTRSLSKSLEEMSQRTNGVVRLKLFKGTAMPVARASEYSLDSHNVQADKAFLTTQHPDGNYFTWRGADGIFSRRTEKGKL
jgi:argininosuccinate synthase